MTIAELRTAAGIAIGWRFAVRALAVTVDAREYLRNPQEAAARAILISYKTLARHAVN